MKLLLIFLTLLLPAALFALSEDRPAQPYSVAASTKDPNVKKDRSKLVFTVYKNRKLSGNGSIRYGVDGREYEAQITDGKFWIMTSKGKHVLQLLIPGGYYEITTDSIECKGGSRTGMNLYFTKPEKVYPDPVEPYEPPPTVDKPVIYLYPEEDEQVSVKIAPHALLAFTYPSYVNGWSGVAHPDGSITIGEKTYPYLFWEGEQVKIVIDITSGSIVRKENIVTFLEEKLAGIGLTDQEQTDFITYWGPLMTSETSVFVQFAWGEQADKLIGSLEVAPKPDQVNRLYILWKPMTFLMNEQPVAQELPVFDRSGFDVLEWGGIKLPAHDVEEY